MRRAAAGLVWLLVLPLGVWVLPTVRLAATAPSLGSAFVAIGLDVLLVCAAGLCVIGGPSLWYTAALEQRLEQHKWAEAR